MSARKRVRRDAEGRSDGDWDGEEAEKEAEEGKEAPADAADADGAVVVTGARTAV